MPTQKIVLYGHGPGMIGVCRDTWAECNSSYGQVTEVLVLKLWTILTFGMKDVIVARGIEAPITCAGGHVCVGKGGKGLCLYA